MGGILCTLHGVYTKMESCQFVLPKTDPFMIVLRFIYQYYLVEKIVKNNISITRLRWKRYHLKVDKIE